MNKLTLVLGIVSLVMMSGCNGDADGAGGAGGTNPDREPPGWYAQSALSIPAADTATYETVVASWFSGVNFLWSYDDLDVFQSYASLTLPRNELIVAVIDTGVDKDHPDLAGRLWVNPGEGAQALYDNGVDDDNDGFVDDFIGWDFVNNDNNPADDVGHGTHVAGTIAALGQGMMGVAPWVRIMPLKVCDATGTCNSDTIRAAMAYAVAKGARIINLSLGALESGADADAFDQAVTAATQAGVLVVAAAGNDGVDVAGMTPANSTYAMAVSAYRNDGLGCSFSNIGWKIDVAGPGCGFDGMVETAGILSANSRKCGPAGDQYCQTADTTPDNNYALKAGTSMSAPHAAGLAAVAWTASPTATPLMIRQALLRTGRKEQAGNVSTVFGMGRLSGVNLVNEAQTAPGVKITSPHYGTTASTQTIGFRIEARANPVSWTLRYVSDSTPSNIDLSSGTVIASSATSVGAGEYVNFTQSWSPPASGNYLVILEADSNGQQYYDETLLSM